MRRLRDREILLGAEPQPLVRDDACAGAAGDFYCIIAAAAIDDERFGGEGGGRKAIRQLCASIACNYNERQGKRGEQIGHRV
jgi:hypothetical protein